MKFRRHDLIGQLETARTDAIVQHNLALNEWRTLVEDRKSEIRAWQLDQIQFIIDQLIEARARRFYSGHPDRLTMQDLPKFARPLWVHGYGKNFDTDLDQLIIDDPADAAYLYKLDDQRGVVKVNQVPDHPDTRELDRLISVLGTVEDEFVTTSGIEQLGLLPALRRWVQ